jgi:hypothetical protein
VGFTGDHIEPGGAKVATFARVQGVEGAFCATACDVHTAKVVPEIMCSRAEHIVGVVRVVGVDAHPEPRPLGGSRYATVEARGGSWFPCVPVYLNGRDEVIEISQPTACECRSFPD